LKKIFTNTIFIGKQVVHLPTCHSTNDIAIQMSGQNLLFEGAIVITDSQSSGKGQRGNSWESEALKNLTFSVLLRPIFLNLSHQYYLNIIISLAVVESLKEYVPEGLKIKWPNDIFYNNNKLGGILIENIIKNNQLAVSIVGIGLNINQLNFNNQSATSLSIICNQTFDLDIVLSKLLPKIEKRYLQLKKGNFDELLEDYYQNMYRFGEWHSFEAEERFIGKIVGIDSFGKLKVEKDNTLHLYDIKEIRFEI
jgi:BirA family transcriptional regulator, biotin operon repressor / biotin---[acetyl-CoA-carboxylase] ligase